MEQPHSQNAYLPTDTQALDDNFLPSSGDLADPFIKDTEEHLSADSNDIAVNLP